MSTECSVAQKPRRRRILFISSGLRTGGAEHVLSRIMRAMERRGYRCGVISLTGEGAITDELRSAGINVDSIDLRHGWRIPLEVTRFAGFVRGFRPDLLQGWMYHGNLAALIARRFAPGRPPVVWSIRQCVYDLAAEKPITRHVIRLSATLSGKVTAAVYPSGISADQHRQLGFRVRHTEIIPNGLDLDRLRPMPERRMVIRKALGIESEQLVIGHVARFDSIKNHEGLLRAVSALDALGNGVRLVLVGPGVDDHNRLLKTWLMQNHLADKVLLLGYREDIPELMAAFDVFCLPSLSEAFPNALAEAAACGCTCVATDVGEAAAILGKNGVLVPPGEHDRLVTALREALAWPAEKRRQTGEKLRQHVAKHFAAGTMIDAFDSLYRSACGINGPQSAANSWNS